VIIITCLLAIFSCTKYEDRERNWKVYTDYTIERLKCGPDELTVIDYLHNKSGDEIVSYQHKHTFERFMKRDEVSAIYAYFLTGPDSLFFVKVIESLPDSLYVKSFCNCNPMVCPR
jgi:hypothetical protein